MASSKKQRRISDVDFASYIVEGTEIHGAYGGKTDLMIAGVLNGDVDLRGTVLIASSGKVNGSVRGTNVIVGGYVRGDVRAREAAEIWKDAVVDGGVVGKEIYVAVGARVKGEIVAQGKKGITKFKERRRAKPAPPPPTQS